MGTGCVGKPLLLESHQLHRRLLVGPFSGMHLHHQGMNLNACHLERWTWCRSLLSVKAQFPA